MTKKYFICVWERARLHLKIIVALSFLMFLSCLYNCGGKKVLHVGLQNFVRERWWYQTAAHFAVTAPEFLCRQLLWLDPVFPSGCKVMIPND